MPQVIGSEEVILKLVQIHKELTGRPLKIMDLWCAIAEHLKNYPKDNEIFLLAFGFPDSEVLDPAYIVDVGGLENDGKLDCSAEGILLTPAGLEIAGSVVLPENLMPLVERIREMAKI